MLQHENKLFLSRKSWWTLDSRTLTPTAPFSDGVWMVRKVWLMCQCMISRNWHNQPNQKAPVTRGRRFESQP